MGVQLTKPAVSPSAPSHRAAVKTKVSAKSQIRPNLQAKPVRASAPKFKTASKSAKPATAPQPSALQKLLTLEGEAFAAKDRLSLKHLAVNKPLSLVETGHVIFIKRDGKRFTFEAITSQSSIDKNAPFFQWLSRAVTKASKTLDFAALQSFSLNSGGADDAKDSFEYPYPHALWTPFSPDPSAGGLLFTRTDPWEDGDKAIPLRLGQIYGLQWTALGRKKRARLTPRKRFTVGACFTAIILAGFIPVPVTTLAKAEIVAANPFIVSAPMDGVIESLNVAPNTLVSTGAVLASFEDTRYRNEYALAQQEMAVATARQRQTGLSAFVDQNTRRELAVVKAEQALAQTREHYAEQMLGKTVLRAQKGGLVLYSDKKDWMGRPVATGERIMEIADPSKVQIRLEASIHDSGALIDKARVKLFLDSDPLRPIEASLTRSSYYAQPQAGGNLAYEGFANFDDQTESSETHTPPRIGARGVAKIYGGTAPLGYWLLRRPLTTLRQFIGA